jgi:hypothetical protein
VASVDPMTDPMAMAVSDCGLANTKLEWWNRSPIGCILWRDRMGVPSRCTIVGAIEQRIEHRPKDA